VRRAALASALDDSRALTVAGALASSPSAPFSPPASAVELDEAVTAVAAVSGAGERAALARSLLSRAYPFAAIRASFSAPSLLRELLREARRAVAEAAGGEWRWAAADAESLLALFPDAREVAEYAAVRAPLAACGAAGAAARARLEAGLLLGVILDFSEQLGAGKGEGGETAEPPLRALDARAELAAAEAARDAQAAELRRARALAAPAAEAAAAAAAALSRRSPQARAVVGRGRDAGAGRASPLRGRAEASAAAAEAASARAAEAVALLERQRAALAAQLAAERTRSQLAQARAAELEARLRDAAAPPPPPPRPASAAGGRPKRASAAPLASEPMEAAQTAPPVQPPSPLLSPSPPPPTQLPPAGEDARAEPQAEVLEYAAWLGMDPVADAAWHYVAGWALTATARLPAGWSVHLDAEGSEYFHCAARGVSTYEHPLDEMHRVYWRWLKERAGQ